MSKGTNVNLDKTVEILIYEFFFTKISMSTNIKTVEILIYEYFFMKISMSTNILKIDEYFEKNLINLLLKLYIY